MLEGTVRPQPSGASCGAYRTLWKFLPLWCSILCCLAGSKVPLFCSPLPAQPTNPQGGRIKALPSLIQKTQAFISDLYSFRRCSENSCRRLSSPSGMSVMHLAIVGTDLLQFARKSEFSGSKISA